MCTFNMPISNPNCRIRPLALAFLLIAAGCSASPKSTTVVEESIAGHRLVVELESVAEAEGPRYAHPVSGTPEELSEKLEVYLGELAYGRAKGKRAYRLLEEGDRKRLAGGLARALKRAGPKERALFLLRVEDNASVAWFRADERVTRGVAYVDVEGRLHLAFDLVDERIDPTAAELYDPAERAQSRTQVFSETGEDIGPSKEGRRRLGASWELSEGQAPSVQAVPAVPKPVAPADAAKLELLEDLLRDGVIDQAEYERRRADLTSPN